MAAEGAIGTPGRVFARRLKERLLVWRRLFMQNWTLFKASRIGVLGLAIMIGFVVLALAAPFMGLRDPIRWTAPDADVIDVAVYWQKESTVSGSELRRAPPISQPVAFRVLPDTFDPRTDRLYVPAGDRLYAFITYDPKPGDPDPARLSLGDNSWGAPGRYFNVSEVGANRTISVPPLLINYGDFVNENLGTDYELYLGTDDGTLFILRDSGSVVPSGSAVARVTVDGAITGLAAFNGDLDGSPRILGDPNHAFWDGRRWVSEQIVGQGDEGEFTSLAINSTGAVHIGFYDVSNGQPRVVVSSGGAWNLRTWESYSFSDNVGLHTSMAIGSDNVARLAYYNETGSALRYAEWNGFVFVPENVDTNGDVGRYPSLALDSTTNNPRIAYYNATGRELKYAERIGGNWTWEVVPNPPGVDAGQYASLALDNTGAPHIAYYDATNGSLMHATRVAGVWTNETVDFVGEYTDIVGQYMSIAVDQVSSDVHVAYYNATNGTLKYARRTGVLWLPAEVVDDGGDVGRYASIALNASRNPAISYHDATNLDLKYALLNQTTSLWENETVASAGHAGLYTSLRFNATGQPHIAHYSFATGRTTQDLVVVGTATGKAYAIDVGIPGVPQRLSREKRVTTWDYRVRWVADVGSEVHLAGIPMRGTSNVPQYSPAFDENGTAVFLGTLDGWLIANSTEDGSSHWKEPDGVTPRAVRVSAGGGWKTAPVVQTAAEGPETQKEIVYAGSNLLTVDNPGTPDEDEVGFSLLFARFVQDGEPLPQWLDTFPGFGGALPLYQTLATPDGGDMSQPAVEGGTIHVGSTSGWLYAIRRDGIGPLEPGSSKWKYRDDSLLGLRPRFTSSPNIVSEKGVLLVAANHNNGTAEPGDDRGVLYSFELSGGDQGERTGIANISWKKTFLSSIPGTPPSWTPPDSIDLQVFVSYGGDAVIGVAALRATGNFLAPSPPHWAHTYECGTATVPRRCPGYPSGNVYWLGLDSQGRDIFSQVIWGSRIALLVGFLSAFFTVVLGVVVGLIAGYVGGKTESVLMRFTDVILVLPGLPLIITLAAVLGASIWNIILVISLLGWPGIARIIRAEVLSLKERPFIDSARVTGASTTRIVFRHIAPNVMPLAFLYMTFSVSGAILTEAALSFIGLGDINTMSWGIMLQLVSQSQALEAWWWLLPPGLAITLISLAFFLVGRAFDEIVNPRLRKR